ncbi:hypothetical protein BDZ88DRAFT_1539 [Geranomyces variabilis]|nr:hypothetical protein BDZ88DRAFT_1539 [Geranomyces variabilis]
MFLLTLTPGVLIPPHQALCGGSMRLGPLQTAEHLHRKSASRHANPLASNSGGNVSNALALFLLPPTSMSTTAIGAVDTVRCDSSDV